MSPSSSQNLLLYKCNAFSILTKALITLCACTFCSLRCESKNSVNFFFLPHSFMARRFILITDLSNLSIWNFFFPYVTCWENRIFTLSRLKQGCSLPQDSFQSAIMLLDLCWLFGFAFLHHPPPLFHPSRAETTTSSFTLRFQSLVWLWPDSGQLPAKPRPQLLLWWHSTRH